MRSVLVLVVLLVGCSSLKKSKPNLIGNVYVHEAEISDAILYIYSKDLLGHAFIDRAYNNLEHILEYEARFDGNSIMVITDNPIERRYEEIAVVIKEKGAYLYWPERYSHGERRYYLKNKNDYKDEIEKIEKRLKHYEKLKKKERIDSFLLEQN